METAPLKAFATSARVELLREIRARITAVLAQGSPERVENPGAVAKLETAVTAGGGGAAGQAHVADRVAYTWFNRIIALRFMDANGYTGIGVVSPAADQIGQPEVLSAAKRGQLDEEVVKRSGDVIRGLLNGTRKPRAGVDAQAEAYELLLVAYCRHWHDKMPFMFEHEGEYTELLIPANLLAEDSVLSRSSKVLTADVCRDVEVIGWLYQFYISERKDEVFAGFKKNKKAGADEIPAATQLFTPHWIVQYLVQNSVGRLWMLNHPKSRLVEQMEYYIAPVDEESDFLKISKPEELTVIDPACGSGHMLTYAFDLLYAIYEEEGYTPSQIPGLILTHNLRGTEIDPRAGALASFALTMKAAAKRKRFFKEPVEPHICVLDPITFSDDELSYLLTSDGDEATEVSFWNQFANADTFGSLIRPDAHLTARLKRHVESLEENVFTSEPLRWASRVLEQATYLSDKYAVVVANPPYMGSKQMNALLSQFMKDEYPTGKSDLFAAFMIRCTELADHRGAVAMITMQSWMFLSSYEKLRVNLLDNQRITSMLHLGPHAFDSIGGEVVSVTAFSLANLPVEAPEYVRELPGAFIRLVEPKSATGKLDLFLDALRARGGESQIQRVSRSGFITVPGEPIAYWLSEKMRASFSTGRPLSEVANLRQGLATADNNRFLRLWWEVSSCRTALACTSREEAASSGARWFPYNKGGEYRKWYGNQEHVVNWENDGREIVSFKPRAVIRNPSTYFSPSVSWSDISSSEAAFRKYPTGFIHDSTGHSAFGDEELLAKVCLLLNSSFVTEVMKVVAPTMHFHIGYVGLVPVSHGIRKLSDDLSVRLSVASMRDWNQREMSWEFACNPLVSLGRLA
ncbi:BREX-1 system adenine-specific DNA-methyltransferase PglX [Pseudoclavibacter alba]|uniref:site-specific DNA-methyltransferase (adenine-specific) n=1 Tax=Pseudoclavibacter albus TaxID=272241 RepID=A0ABT2HUW9_9MICO|nr:BREX-1 system adenine-specific DNA-methyltransferase PglX [Pseudoclavibacter alba]MCT2042111.1 BREX-1 system adenine-specific DNA-methyltransferase PglX [Pseudoclavibacter alba]